MFNYQNFKKMEKNELKNSKGNEIKSLKLYNFVLYGVWEVDGKVELGYVEARKNEWNCENKIVGLYNEGLKKGCLGYIMRLEKGDVIKIEEVIRGRVLSFEEWERVWMSGCFKGFRLVEVKGDEAGKRVMGEVFTSLDMYVQWVKSKGYVMCSKVKGSKVYRWEAVE